MASLIENYLRIIYLLTFKLEEGRSSIIILIDCMQELKLKGKKLLKITPKGEEDKNFFSSKKRSYEKMLAQVEQLNISSNNLIAQVKKRQSGFQRVILRKRTLEDKLKERKKIEQEQKQTENEMSKADAKIRILQKKAQLRRMNETFKEIEAEKKKVLIKKKIENMTSNKKSRKSKKKKKSIANRNKSNKWSY